MRYARKIDTNQTEIVNTFRQIGASVAITSAVGKGFPDLVVGYAGRTLLVEIKSTRTAKHTPDQLAFQSTWKGNYFTVRTREDAIALINNIIGGSKHV